MSNYYVLTAGNYHVSMNISNLNMAKYYVYIAICNDNTLYTGYTNDLEHREFTHNEGKGARYTRMRRPVKIVYSEGFLNRSEAMKREYQIKQLSKIEKEELISRAQ